VTRVTSSAQARAVHGNVLDVLPGGLWYRWASVARNVASVRVVRRFFVVLQGDSTCLSSVGGFIAHGVLCPPDVQMTHLERGVR
jgi:hypothetical protein